ncbi:hypothetical protein ABZP36_007385 [Zizania latifolia]
MRRTSWAEALGGLKQNCGRRPVAPRCLRATGVDLPPPTAPPPAVATDLRASFREVLLSGRRDLQGLPLPPSDVRNYRIVRLALGLALGHVGCEIDAVLRAFPCPDHCPALDLFVAVPLAVEHGSPVKHPLYQGSPSIGPSKVRIIDWNNDLV